MASFLTGAHAGGQLNDSPVLYGHARPDQIDANVACEINHFLVALINMKTSVKGKGTWIGTLIILLC